MDLDLTGKVALVTGAGRGIGLAIARTLAAEGAGVVVNDYYTDRAEAGAAAIEREGGRALGLAADVTDGAAVVDLVARAYAWHERLDILVNNAGIPAVTGLAGAGGGGFGPRFEETTAEFWRQTMDVITLGTLNCTHAALPHLIAAAGRVICIVSDAGRVGEPRLAPYSMAKGGVIAFAKALARETGRHGVTVNCVSPATTETEALAGMLADRSPEGEARIQAMLRAYPLGRHRGRLGQPQDIADAVAFLASARASWITGQTLSVNGGYSMS